MKIVFIGLLMLCLTNGAHAVIVAGGDGLQNTNAPTGGQGWNYVGRIDKGSVYSGVTYISNNWFITAYHIKALDNPTAVLLDGISYTIDPNSWKRLVNSDDGNADLIMFRVVGGEVGLPGLTVRSSSISNGSSLTMIGNGRNRETSETTWNSSWVEGGTPTAYSGYKWAAGATKRWGTNTKDASAGLVDDGFGITDMFRTDFDDAGGDQAQGATYDSGGGVFYSNGGDWELAGIMLTVSGYGSQPASTAVYGNRTYMAYMKYYASQISDIALIDDLDEDGIPDGWEYAYTGSSTGVVTDVDQDNDGFTGEEEWITDTDPTLGSSFLQVTSFTNGMDIVFSSSTNRSYQIEQNENLTNAVWTAASGWFAGSQPTTATNLSVVGSNRFYRVRAKL